jgi:hypothetical protein
MSKLTVFIQCNEKQYFGAKLSEYTLKKNSKDPDKFEVRLMLVNDYPKLFGREGQKYLRRGHEVTWINNNLQSFTPTRFMPPELMNFKGRALVIDPDVFAVPGFDVLELLEKDMQGHAILCHYKLKEAKKTGFRTSVMLLDCEKLAHWQWEKNIEDLFKLKFDYRDWMSLELEDPNTIGLLPETYNHYDTLKEDTKLIHFTKRLTQPWKTGLPIDFNYDQAKPKYGFIPRSIVDLLKKLLKPEEFPSDYQDNPSLEQKKFFFSTTKEAVESGFLDRTFLENQVNEGHVRSDLFTQLSL